MEQRLNFAEQRLNEDCGNVFKRNLVILKTVHQPWLILMNDFNEQGLISKMKVQARTRVVHIELRDKREKAISSTTGIHIAIMTCVLFPSSSRFFPCLRV
ncbi:LOW QUALITY PROTEIN: hypothetical protein V1478_016510 [Vespula squamosa]|uniref:Uncharacterized protein n=1 Tax=Vespula squamosa TaxID=30214 RepID=A0ABD2A025_VESSQ